MSTTALLVEILIIGFEVSLWLILILALLPNKHWVDSLLSLSKDNAIIAAGLLLAVTYVLGIIADKTAKWIVEISAIANLFRFKSRIAVEKDSNRSLLEKLFRPYDLDDSKESKSNIAAANETLEKYSVVVMKKGDPMSDLLYGRSKVRILRASIFNVPVLILTAALAPIILTIQQASDSPIQLNLLVAVAIGLAGLILAILLVRYLNWLYCYNLYLFRHRLDYLHSHASVNGILEKANGEENE